MSVVSRIERELSGSRLPAAMMVKLAVRLAEVVANPARHRAVDEAVADRLFAGIRARQPKLAVKYLNRRHLAVGLTTDERAALMIHHYHFLAQTVPTDRAAAMLDRGLVLWTHDGAPGRHCIDLGFSHPTDNEGELTLTYSLDGVVVSVCSFSFAPGSLVAARGRTVIALTRIQGMRDERERLRAAMRALDGLSPAMVFLAALTGIADRFGLTAIAGVAAAAQPALDAPTGHAQVAAYDAFFDSLGGVRASPIFYRIDLPRAEKPLSETKSGNRARTRAQRGRRAVIAEAARRAFSS